MSTQRATPFSASPGWRPSPCTPSSRHSSCPGLALSGTGYRQSWSRGRGPCTPRKRSGRWCPRSRRQPRTPATVRKPKRCTHLRHLQDMRESQGESFARNPLTRGAELLLLDVLQVAAGADRSHREEPRSEHLSHKTQSIIIN